MLCCHLLIHEPKETGRVWLYWFNKSLDFDKLIIAEIDVAQKRKFFLALHVEIIPIQNTFFKALLKTNLSILFTFGEIT